MFNFFASRCVIIVVIVGWNQLKFEMHANQQCFFPSV
jgi:hypothetical protein